jgi:hypothetical protein
MSERVSGPVTENASWRVDQGGKNKSATLRAKYWMMDGEEDIENEMEGEIAEEEREGEWMDRDRTAV